MSVADTIICAVNDSSLASPAREKSACSPTRDAVVVAVFNVSPAAPVHLNVVLGNSFAVSQRTPCPARHRPGSFGLILTLSGPCLTSSKQVKPPPDLTKPVARSCVPPPLRETRPVGKPL